MKLEILHDDPLAVLGSTRSVVENAKFVFIDERQLNELAQAVAARFKGGFAAAEMGFRSVGDLEQDAQLIFLEDTVNFSFWVGKNELKWRVGLPDGAATQGGWFALVACFERALAARRPILEAAYLADISPADGRDFFCGLDGVEIPLLDERLNNFRESGRVLLERFDGRFVNAVEEAHFDAPTAAKLIVENFSSFRDVSKWDGTDVCFYKRAQICAYDLGYVFRTAGKTVVRTEGLTAFADYKVPQILRLFGVLRYEKELADRIDNYFELPHDSREEIEIRAASIWAVELLRQRAPQLTAVEIDNTLWLMSQDIQAASQPYHRTRTIFY